MPLILPGGKVLEESLIRPLGSICQPKVLVISPHVPTAHACSMNLVCLALRISRSSTTQNPLDTMRSYMASLPTATARSEALQTLTRVLLQYSALSNECSHLVLGTSLTSLAVSLISGVACGDGFHVKEEIQEEWTPEQIDLINSSLKADRKQKHGLRIIRPLRDIGMKECGAWAWWMDLKVLGRESWDWPGCKLGLGALTKGQNRIHTRI